MRRELEKYLPKDLSNIIEEYAKDRTNYDKVVSDLNLLILDIRIFCEDCSEECFIDHFVLNVFEIQERILGKEAIYKKWYVPEFWWEPSHWKSLKLIT